MNNKNNIKYFSAAIFLICAILIAVSQNNIFWYIELISFILVIVGIVISQPILIGCGGFTMLIRLYPTVIYLSKSLYYTKDSLPFTKLIYYSFALAYFLIMLFTFLPRKKHIMLYASSIFLLFGFLFTILRDKEFSFNAIYICFQIIGFVLCGFLFQKWPIVCFQKVKTDNPDLGKQDVKISIDELEKYKMYLDNGLITQEEFEMKKKQVLVKY